MADQASALGSPKAICGESYGGQRVAALTGCWPSNMRSTSTARFLISPALNVEVTTPAIR